MKATTISTVGCLAALASAAKQESTFAVLRFNGDQFLTEGRIDPVVNPGEEATHYHGIMGGSNFGKTVQGNDLMDSKCTTAKIKNDKSNYWAPTLFFQDPNNPTNFTKVPLMYMNVYYFFEETNDDLVSFPPGLKMLSGDTHTRDPPAFGGAINKDPDAGPIQPVQWTCPRTSYNPPSYPADSDGTKAGLQDPNNEGAGAGFPLYDCDGLYSPLRADIHFPSCYNPKAGLDDYKNNMAWPTNNNGKLDCPAGWIHVPHLFFELYWQTPLFAGQWTPDGVTQPFVLSNGDVTGYSLHADFISGWDEATLNRIIQTCNAGSLGMDTCPDIPGGLNEDNNCKIEPAVTEPETLITSNGLGAYCEKLPGNNPLSGWGRGGDVGSPEPSSSAETTAYPTSSPATSYVASSSPTEEAVEEATTYPAVTTSTEEAATTPTTEAYPTTTDAGRGPGYHGKAAATSDGAMVVAAADNGIETVWDIVTVTATQTEYSEPTAASRRRRHNHLARHHLQGSEHN